MFLFPDRRCQGRSIPSTVRDQPGGHGRRYQGDGSGRSGERGLHRSETSHGDFSGVLGPSGEFSPGGNGPPGSVGKHHGGPSKPGPGGPEPGGDAALSDAPPAPDAELCAQPDGESAPEPGPASGLGVHGPHALRGGVFAPGPQHERVQSP